MLRSLLMITVHRILLQIRKHVYLSMCAFVVFLGALYFACAVAITVVPHYQQQIALKLSHLLGEPVDFQKIRFHWRGFSLYAKVYNLNIGDNNDKIFIDKISSIEFLIHPIKSLLWFSPIIDDITISGGRIYFDLKKSNITTQDNFNLDKLQKHLASVINNPFLSWVNVNQINLKNTNIILNDGIQQSEYILSSLNIYNTSDYNYLHGQVYQINKLYVKNKEREVLEIALKFDKTNAKQATKFYITTNSSGLTSIVKDYIEPAINKNTQQTKVNSIVMDPRTSLKIWGGILNHNPETDQHCVEQGIAATNKASINQVQITSETTCKNKIHFSDDIQIVLHSPEILASFSNDQQLGLTNIHAVLALDPNTYSLLIHTFIAKFAGSDFNVVGTFSRPTNDAAAQINTRINFGHTDFRQFLTKLPLGLVIPDAHKWLKQHINHGWLGKADIIWRGAVDQSFPYDPQYDQTNGVFLMQAELAETEVDYANGEWPKISELYGILNIRGREISIDSDGAQISNSQVEHLTAKIEQLGKNQHNNLNIVSKIKTNGADLHQIIASSPLKKDLGGLIKTTNFSGPMSLTLNLDIPLEIDPDTKVQGNLAFDNSSLLVKDTPFILTNLNGNLNFTEHTVHSENLQAQLQNSPVTLSVANDNDNKGTFVKANSAIDVNYLSQYYKYDLNNKVSGMTNFDLDMNIRDIDNKSKLIIAIKSDLVGIQSHLMEPYAKDKQQAVPFNLTIESGASDQLKYNVKVKDNNATQDYTYLDISKSRHQTNIDVQAKFMDGQIVFNDLDNKTIANLNRFNWQKTEKKPANSQKEDYLSWPNLNANIKNLFVDNKLLGEVTFNTKVNKQNKTFSINKFILNSDALNLSLDADYNINQHKTKAFGNYRIHDLAAVTKLFNMENISAKLKLKGAYDLEWPNEVLEPNLSEMDGRISIDSGRGRINDIELGFGRLLGLFNLSALDKRLRLDFSDVFEDGYKFDNIQGKFKLNKGVVDTAKTSIRSDTIDIELYGSIDLNKKNYNLFADVTPHISSLPVAAAIIATPIAGAAVFIIDKLLDSPVDQLTERSYSISGPWDKPIIIKTKRKRGPLIEVSWFNPVEY